MATGFKVVTPPKPAVGRRKREVDPEFLAGYAEALKGAAEGDVVAIDRAFSSHATAQSHATRLRIDLAENGHIDNPKSVRARIWQQEDETWAFGLRIAKPDSNGTAA